METPPPLSAATTPAAVPPPQPPQPHTNYPDSVDSSPRSRHTDSWDDLPPQAPPQAAKLRLMCSYGGHIVPRPHDKTLCYIGGDTRIIVIDRQSSLCDLHHRLSKSLLNNQPFTLKYQLPSEELDSLITVTTDEDLENMVEEYERLNNNNKDLSLSKSGRIRLFLFPKSSSVEQLIETASTKSDEWFFQALNGKVNNTTSIASDRGFSDTSSVNNLLGLDDDFVGKTSNSVKDVEAQLEGSKTGGVNNLGFQNTNVNNQDVHSVPDSPMLESNSSFGSTSSSPSVANLPPIRVHVDENQKVGIEEQFQQMNVGGGGNAGNFQQQKVEDVVVTTAAGLAAGTVVSGVPLVVGGEYANRVVSDDERSDHGGYKMVQAPTAHQHVQVQLAQQQQQQQQQYAQLHQKQTGVFDLPSPDSASSDGSVSNPLSRHKQNIYQEQVVQIQPGSNRVPAYQVDPKTGDQNNSRVQVQQQLQEPGYMLHGQFDQNHPQLQQFVHAGAQFMQAGAMPIASYYPVYPSQPQHQQQHSHHSAIEQQYPVYFMPARPTQTYNIPVQQPSYGESPVAATSSRSQTPPAAVIPSSAAYSQARNAPLSKPEMSAGVYRTAAPAAAPQYVQVPSSQHQAQYVGFQQIHPSQSVTPPSSGSPNYAYEIADATHAQLYYTQPLPPQIAAQYQTMTSAPAVVLPEVSAQLPTDNVKQQIRTSQP